MAFVQKTGKRWGVYHGGTGQLLRSFGSRGAADAHMRQLHKTHKPSAAGRGQAAAKRLKRR